MRSISVFLVFKKTFAGINPTYSFQLEGDDALWYFAGPN